jgi:hypothetical protein
MRHHHASAARILQSQMLLQLLIMAKIAIVIVGELSKLDFRLQLRERLLRGGVTGSPNWVY